MTFDHPAGYKAYVAEPRTRSLKPTVLVIHENRGLNDHIRDVARRIALEGFRAVAPDLLSPSGGTPANEDAARDAIGKLDLAKSTADAVTMLDRARQIQPRRQGRRGRLLLGRRFRRPARGRGRRQARRRRRPITARRPTRPKRPRSRRRCCSIMPASTTASRRPPFPWVTALRAAGKTVTFQSMTASITPSTTTPRPSATTSRRPTSPGAAPSASSTNISANRKGPADSPPGLPFVGFCSA